MLVVFNKTTGNIIKTVLGQDNYPEFYLTAENDVIVTDADIDDLSYYVDDGVIVAKQARPSILHDWSWSSKSWQLNAEKAVESKKSAILLKAYSLSKSPILFELSPFDADDLARSRITPTLVRLLQGRGLPAGWIGWRDADNIYHWADMTSEEVAAKLGGLSSAIEDREQALLEAVWNHKDALAAAALSGDPDALINYPVDTGWPT